MDLHATRADRLFVALLVALGVSACNALGITGEDDNEVRVVVQALGADFLDADDGHRYFVDANTEYEGAGLTGFADLVVGNVVEIEWTSLGDARRALEIETGEHDESGDD